MAEELDPARGRINVVLTRRSSEAVADGFTALLALMDKLVRLLQYRDFLK